MIMNLHTSSQAAIDLWKFLVIFSGKMHLEPPCTLVQSCPIFFFPLIADEPNSDIALSKTLSPPGFQFCGASQGRGHFPQFRLCSPSVSSVSDAAGGHRP
jgi:hypothetical protein